jgi:hypothetical protein
VTPRLAPRRGALLAAVALAGCGLSYEMERAGPPGAVCPATSEQPAVAAPPDTTVCCGGTVPLKSATAGWAPLRVAG